MHQSTHVTVHESESPAANSLLLREGLRRKVLPQKFLYHTHGQTGRWLALHRAWSPAERDAKTIDLYTGAAHSAAAKITTPVIHVVGLGCGGAQKEAKVIKALRNLGKTVVFTPVETSLSMVLTAAEHTCGEARGLQCHPVLADLPHCSTLPALLKPFEPAGAERVICLFGILHTFEPGELLPRILNSIRSQDYFLLSANLADENNYEKAVAQILPQYDNAETRDWLQGALLQLGFERGDGAIRVCVEEGLGSLLRFAAYFDVGRPRTIQVEEEQFHFAPGDSIQVFFSYRYTVSAVRTLLAACGLAILESALAPEEGVFLCARKAQKNNP